jgi:steroid 5-alpha reductase family enzyme
MVVVWGAAALLVLATAGWALSAVRRNANVADELWGVAQIVLAAVCLSAGEARTARSWLAAGLVAVWGLRLSLHLRARDRRRGEDWRHRAARRRQPGFVWRSLPEVFWLQLVGGGLVVGLPLFAVVAPAPPGLGWLDGLGVALWVVGFAVETVADVELARFGDDGGDRRRVLDRGLWRYSRHPNYFGEAVLWTGMALLGVAAGAWWALLSPLMVLIVVLRISGVAVMDEHLLATRGEAYADYVRATSPFVPLPKRSTGLHVVDRR